MAHSSWQGVACWQEASTLPSFRRRGQLHTDEIRLAATARAQHADTAGSIPLGALLGPLPCAKSSLLGNTHSLCQFLQASIQALSGQARHFNLTGPAAFEAAGRLSSCTEMLKQSLNAASDQRIFDGGHVLQQAQRPLTRLLGCSCQPCSTCGVI